MQKILTFILSVIPLYLFGQTDTIAVEHYDKTGINYKCYVIDGDRLYAVNDSGRLVIWDLNKYELIPFQKGDTCTKYTTIAKDRNNDIFIGSNWGTIAKLDKQSMATHNFKNVRYYIWSIFFNLENVMFLAVPYALYCPDKHRIWTKFGHHTDGIQVIRRYHKIYKRKLHKYFSLPIYSFTDRSDRIWMANSHGEFGGDVQVFDATNRKPFNDDFDSLDYGLLFPNSVFEDNEGNIYITSGLNHMMTFGAIFKIDGHNKVTNIYESKEKYIPDLMNSKKHLVAGKPVLDTEYIVRDAEFVGPGAFNKRDTCIYVVLSSGIFKAKMSGADTALHFIPLFKTGLHWGREPQAIGYAMLIKKIEFTDSGNILFLTENDGIAIYDGKAVRILL
jgi:hypothetical protein